MTKRRVCIRGGRYPREGVSNGILRDMVNKRAVCILLECILVFGKRPNNIMMSYLCKIGRFADAVDTTKSDDVRTLVLLSLHCVTQDINAAFRSQNLDTSLLQGVANGRCHGWEINKGIITRTNPSSLNQK